MALVSGARSTLNPNAPLFIPAAFRQVEDFSPEWWQLVTTSTWYRDYWLSLHPEGFDQAEDELDDVVDLLPDSIDFSDGDDFSSMEAQYEEFIKFTEAEGNKLVMNGSDSIRSVDALKTLDTNGIRSKPQPARYAEKPSKNASLKYSPRCIQQPR